MNDDIIKRRRGELSKQQAMYVAKRETGAAKEQSAIFAGYPAGQKAGDQVEESPTVQAELAKAREALAKEGGITKEDVLAGMIEAAGMAKVMADPQAMVRAWSEIAKMLGYYAPEKKSVEHNLGKESIEAMKGMSDAQLHRLAKGRVIDSTAKDVTPDE